MSQKVLIIGGVAGGASCAARLRRLDENAEIVLLERGPYISYANCGLPYHVGDVIKSRSALLLQTPEAMRQKFEVDVRVKNEAVAIDREAKTVTVKRTETGETYSESYDTLVISTGSSPMRPPIPGIDHPRIQSLWTVPDADTIRTLIKEQNVQSAVVVGGGFIGLEMAENLRHAGLAVTLVEMLDQVMAPLDYEMAQPLHENIRQNGVNLLLKDGVAAFAGADNSVTVQLKSGKTIETGLVVLAIGVKPNGDIAKAAGLTVNARGGIVVDKYMRTSDPAIYAVGDVATVADLVLGGETMIPLAGPANKQGRIAADNIAGRSVCYEGSQGTSVVKVFDLTAASTGLNERALQKQNMVRGKDYEAVTITQNSHAGYYPGALPMTLKMLFSMDGKKIFGAQIVGREGVDKRIDTLAVTQRLGGGIKELTELELAYAPPFSSAKDPVNMLGFSAENVLSGLARFAPWDAPVSMPDAQLLDVREEVELMAFSVPGAKHIPLGQLRSRLSELDRRKEVVVFCAIGVRAYNAARILAQHGFERVYVYPGGARFYQATHFDEVESDVSAGAPVADSGDAADSDEPVASMRIDCSGMQCPGPILKVFETMKGMKTGEVMEVSASDPGFARDIGAWCRRTGNTLLVNEQQGDDYVALVRKGGAPAPAQAAGAAPQGKTIIVFSGNLDKVLASFIIANGAAAMGRPVTMFFTFWGLTALRRPEKVKVKKSFMEKMFGAMLPRGTRKLKLSRMNMAGMGTGMMKMIMKQKNVDTLESLIQKAMAAGVHLVACTMSMDVMGIHPEELIDGVELGGVGAYLGDAEESNVNLFI
jgi:NADPH-dependent 2,4-dienoyl-CoA reductase/sulfur reductase-like enzyme/peroxiredoxin family protein/TusA-related sulfurtransferase/rhodanese-related sulfurtransferase